MEFVRPKEEYAEEAAKLAEAAYRQESRQVEALVDEEVGSLLIPRIADLFRSGHGAVAIDKGAILGYMAFWGGINGQFGDVLGSYSPLYGNSYSGRNRGMLASRLFQHAAGNMVKEGICSYSLTLYAHDREVAEALGWSGFGMRCADAIRFVNTPLPERVRESERHTDPPPLLTSDSAGVRFEELPLTEVRQVLPLKNKLIRHLGASPVFFPARESTAEELDQLSRKRQSRFFIARLGTAVIGYMEVIRGGETFIADREDVRNICGAYLEESERGKGIYTRLLGFVLDTLKREGVRRLGVDCETLNPTAHYFWRKSFDYYTYSFVRRIDERIREGFFR